MINRLVLATATAAAVVVVVTPAAIGLRGTSSFTQNIPVPVPSDAHRLRSDDPILVRESGRATSTPARGPSRSVSVSVALSPEMERHGARTSGVDDGAHRSGSAAASTSGERHSGADDRSVRGTDGASIRRGRDGSESGGSGSGRGGSDDGSGGGSHSGGHG